LIDLLYFGARRPTSTASSKERSPAELPVQAPTKFELTINLKAAKALGISVPPSMITRADQVLD
jgi:putative ABC transport system substrate-binding protein